jgi:15-cis-phytoene synthase
MRISALAVVAVLSTVSHTDAFVAPNHVKSMKQENFQLPILHSFTAPIPPASRSNRSETELDQEQDVVAPSVPVTAASGRILEGGKVIDFQSLRGPSMAEHALEEAKIKVAQSTRRHGEPSTGILGINQDVIAVVGHELGTFATSYDIQNCAAYLRSLAAPGFFEERAATAVVNGEKLPSSQKAEFDRILRQAYMESGEVTSAFAKTFYLGTQLLPEASREAIWAIYVWCRRTDEIVDAPRDSNDEMLQDLGAWEMRLQSLWDFGEVADVYDLCLLDVLVKYPTLKIDPFKDMIRGMLMDVPQLGQDRYDSFNDLHLYCYRVAGTVGLMCLPVFGCAEGYDEIIAK